MKYEEKPGIAERVVAMRKRFGLRQRDAAAEIGICRKYLGWIENGWVPHEGIWAKVREWLEAKEAAAAALDEAAREETAGGEETAGEEDRPAQPPGDPDLPPRVQVQVRLAIRRLVGQK